jgi:hypothetical protein
VFEASRSYLKKKQKRATFRVFLRNHYTESEYKYFTINSKKIKKLFAHVFFLFKIRICFREGNLKSSYAWTIFISAFSLFFLTIYLVRCERLLFFAVTKFRICFRFVVVFSCVLFAVCVVITHFRLVFVHYERIPIQKSTTGNQPEGYLRAKNIRNCHLLKPVCAA